MGLRKRFRSPKITTVIGKGTAIEGNVLFSGGLHVDGVVRGNIISEAEDERATLTLSEVGTVEGNVRVANVMLNGAVVGDVIATRRVELAPKARITGTLTYAMLEMEMGAEVNGKLIHAEQSESPQLPYDGEVTPLEPE